MSRGDWLEQKCGTHTWKKEPQAANSNYTLAIGLARRLANMLANTVKRLLKISIQTNALRMEQNANEKIASGQGATPFAQAYFHGTKADLKVGDLIEVGFNSNYG